EVAVAGLPLHESGDESDLSRESRAFAAALATKGSWTIEFAHEGLTSWEAEERLRARGVPPDKARREGLVDREAAVVLLRAWLDERGGGTGPLDEDVSERDGEPR